MPGLLTNANGQVQIDTDVVTAPHTADIQTMQILPGVEGARLIRAVMIVDALTTPIEITVTVTLRDIAFEEHDMFGGSLTAKERLSLLKKF